MCNICVSITCDPINCRCKKCIGQFMVTMHITHTYPQTFNRLNLFPFPICCRCRMNRRLPTCRRYVCGTGEVANQHRTNAISVPNTAVTSHTHSPSHTHPHTQFNGKCYYAIHPRIHQSNRTTTNARPHVRTFIQTLGQILIAVVRAVRLAVAHVADLDALAVVAAKLALGALHLVVAVAVDVCRRHRRNCKCITILLLHGG